MARVVLLSVGGLAVIGDVGDKLLLDALVENDGREGSWRPGYGASLVCWFCT